MNPSFEFLVLFLKILVVMDVLSILAVFIMKSTRRQAYKHRMAASKMVKTAFFEADKVVLLSVARRHRSIFIDVLGRTVASCRPSLVQRSLAREVLHESGIAGWAVRTSRSWQRYRRIRAYCVLGLSGDDAAVSALLAALSVERSHFARLVILDHLAVSDPPPPIAKLVSILEGLESSFGEREVSVLRPLAPLLQAHFESSGLPTSDVGLRLFLLGVVANPTEEAWQALSGFAEDRDDGMGRLAAETMADAFPPSWFLDAFARRSEPRFRIPYARLLGGVLDAEDVWRLDPWFDDPELRDAGIAAVAEIDRRFPEKVGVFLDAIASGNEARGVALSLALEHRYSFLTHHARSPLQPGLIAMTRYLLKHDRVEVILNALESVLPAQVQADLTALTKEESRQDQGLSTFFARHGSTSLRERLELPPLPSEANKPRIPVTAAQKVFLIAFVTLGLLIFPTIFYIHWAKTFHYLTWSEMLYRAVFDYHYFFAYYTIAVNTMYLLFMVLSAIKLVSQSRIWNTELQHLLFAGGVLPSITIVVPAYQEEETLADSVESLLSLAYPRFDVVVVNDGSGDRTMEAAIQAFELEPASPGSEGSLPCMPVRSVYRSRRFPNLIMVDKANGGKADALNAGINFARGEYVCCIDADSLLDPQALVRAMLQVLARRRDVVAIGGNIVPVNGSVVEHGHLQEIALPEDPLAALQTIEYLRSFISGRLGWALADGLLIISGAFGIFRRDRVLEAGGYLTGSGRFRQDTVGEDMELVVRLLRRERESGRKGAVDYCYNANCWTEVPELRGDLSKQRNRWHRGLLEVLSFHRAISLKPRYGMSGMVTVPYLFLFEIIGPWLEAGGYVAMALSLALSLVDPLISLVVLSVAFTFGFFVSTFTLFLAEMQVVYFRTPEFLRLIFLAFVENFGFRQVVSLGRVSAFVRFFMRPKGWQKFGRRGFARAGQKS